MLLTVLELHNSGDRPPSSTAANTCWEDILVRNMLMCVCRVFAVSGSGSRMHIVDRQGAVILTLKSKSFSAHNKWYIYSGNSAEKADKIATVKPQSGSVTAEVHADICYLHA